MSYRFPLAGLLMALLLFSAPLGAQTFGEITGSVTDSTGAVVAGATVAVTNTATGVERRVTTNEVGNYTVPFLNPGTYNITSQLEGFKQATRQGLILQVGDVARVNFDDGDRRRHRNDRGDRRGASAANREHGARHRHRAAAHRRAASQRA